MPIPFSLRRASALALILALPGTALAQAPAGQKAPGTDRKSVV